MSIKRKCKNIGKNLDIIKKGCLMDKIGRNELCPCGSNKKFKKCHINSKDKEIYTGKRQSALMINMWRKSGQEECMFKGDDNNCTNNIIGAHSIQNNGVISRLAEDGHVLMPISDFNNNGIPNASLKKISRNKATTFTGFCHY
ncbi:MAG: SEC-C domain-containing protein, partial [Atopostipes sp.]|nr:SEC-C domain-containing protein [Atopostipes sp.]